MEGDKVRLRTYRQVWLQEHVIYQIERVRLPFPVSFRQAGIFGAAAAGMALLSRLPGVGSLSPGVRYLLLPGLLAWFLTRQRLDGKPPLRWALSWLLYALGPRRLNRFQPLRPEGARRFRGRIGYRLRGSRPPAD